MTKLTTLLAFALAAAVAMPAAAANKQNTKMSECQTQAGENTLGSVGPTIGLRHNLSFSVTTNAAEVATRSAATKSAGASRSLIGERWGRPGEAERARDGAPPPRREQSSRPPERRL